MSLSNCKPTEGVNEGPIVRTVEKPEYLRYLYGITLPSERNLYIDCFNQDMQIRFIDCKEILIGCFFRERMVVSDKCGFSLY